MIPIYPADQLNKMEQQAPLQGEATLSGLTNPPPLSLYIHIPWCVEKCPYCDFNSHQVRDGIPEAAYVDALIADLEQAAPLVWGRKVQTVFFGGGTPSLFSAAAIDRILAHVRMLTPLQYDAEITLEANPGTVDITNFEGFRAAGVNRLSLGIQSFQNQFLSALGRIHNAEQALEAIKVAKANFEQVNLDVMYALPKQNLQDVIKDAEQACALEPNHLSFYHLTIEPNTAFHRQVPQNLPDDDLSAEMQLKVEETLGKNGFHHYETSAFAQPGAQCQHNLNYWRFGDYLGIGAGAHSKLSFHDKIVRQRRHQHPKRYLANAVEGKAVDENWEIKKDELGFEFMMNALRLNNGVAVDLFQQRTGLPIAAINKTIKTAVSKGLLHPVDSVIQPTSLGRRFLNDLLALFLVEKS